MSQIKAALFDFGGTLFDYRTLREAEYASRSDLASWCGLQPGLAELKAAYRDAAVPIFTDYLEKPYYLHRDLFFDIMEKMIEVLGGELNDDLFDRYRDLQWQRQAECFKVRPGVYETLTELRNKGIYLGIVSNIDEDQLNHFLDLSKLRPYFDSCLSSEAAQSCKPDSGFFNMALELAGCRPGEALFIGDSIEADVAGSNKLGMQSVLIWDLKDREHPTDGPIPMHVIRKIPDLLGLV